jgi:hypothetical protein
MSFGMDRGLEPIGAAWARGHYLATTCHDVNDIIAAVPIDGGGQLPTEAS